MPGRPSLARSSLGIALRQVDFGRLGSRLSDVLGAQLRRTSRRQQPLGPVGLADGVAMAAEQQIALGGGETGIGDIAFAAGLRFP